jgi:hypothetical protein
VILTHTQKDSHDLRVRNYFVYVGSGVPTAVTVSLLFAVQTTPMKLIADIIRELKVTENNI